MFYQNPPINPRAKREAFMVFREYSTFYKLHSNPYNFLGVISTVIHRPVVFTSSFPLSQLILKLLQVEKKNYFLIQY